MRRTPRPDDTVVLTTAPTAARRHVKNAPACQCGRRYMKSREMAVTVLFWTAAIGGFAVSALLVTLLVMLVASL